MGLKAAVPGPVGGGPCSKIVIISQHQNLAIALSLLETQVQLCRSIQTPHECAVQQTPGVCRRIRWSAVSLKAGRGPPDKYLKDQWKLPESCPTQALGLGLDLHLSSSCWILNPPAYALSASQWGCRDSVQSGTTWPGADCHAAHVSRGADR